MEGKVCPDELESTIDMIDDPEHFMLGDQYPDYLVEDAPMLVAEIKSLREQLAAAQSSLEQKDAECAIMRQALKSLVQAVDDYIWNEQLGSDTAYVNSRNALNTVWKQSREVLHAAPASTVMEEAKVGRMVQKLLQVGCHLTGSPTSGYIFSKIRHVEFNIDEKQYLGDTLLEALQSAEVTE